MTTPHSAPELIDLIQWLRHYHDTVMDVEARALAQLSAGDPCEYAVTMRRKAEMLAAMAEEAKPLLAALPGETRFNYALALESFSASARMALRLNSSFYMSALLYPDDHKPGQPDNLSLRIDAMERQGMDFRAE